MTPPHDPEAFSEVKRVMLGINVALLILILQPG